MIEAFVLLKSVERVGLMKGDCFVQSPFNEDEFYLSRQPSRPPYTRDFIQQYIDLYQNTCVSRQEIPELMMHWEDQAKTNFIANQLLLKDLEQQRNYIDERINKILTTNDKLTFWMNDEYQTTNT